MCLSLCLCLHVDLNELLDCLSESSMRVCVWASFLLCFLASVSSTPCLPEEFTCARGGCVSEEHVCDFRENCADGSDETNCKY